MSSENWQKNHYLFRLLIFGVILTIFGLYELQEHIVVKSGLKELKGTLQAADIYMAPKTGKCELIFYLNEYEKKFYLAGNLGDDAYDKKYSDILMELKRVDSISVWVRFREVDHYQPKVFQISNHKNIILDFREVRTEKSFIILLALTLGIGAILWFLYRKFPDTWHKVMHKSQSERDL